MKVIIEEGILTLRIKLSSLDAKEINEGNTVIKTKELRVDAKELGLEEVWRLNVEVCKE